MILEILKGVSAMSSIRLRSLFLIVVFWVTACSSPYTINPNFPNHSVKKQIGVFIDGTNNDPISDTNVVRLRNLAFLQDNQAIHTIYINGVGTEGGPIKKIAGLTTGYGIDDDAQNALLYLSDVYREGDEILIFGFSRGAFTARVLAGVIAVAGLPDFKDINQSGLPEDQQKNAKERLIKDVFNAVEGEGSLAERKERLKALGSYTSKSVSIKFLGLWDTVPAIGFPSFQPDISKMEDRMPSRYYDQLCNVEYAAHAMSIDDNRVKVFEPLTLTYDSLVDDCEPIKSIDSTVDEVWFSGAHADVGGGYNTDLSGISLNWMISRVNRVVPGFLPEGASVFADKLGESHIASKPIFNTRYALPYGNRNRSFMLYGRRESYNDGKVRIHESVKYRINKLPRKSLEYDWGDDLNNSPSHDYGPPVQCVIDHGRDGSGKPGTYTIIGEKKCFDLVGDKDFVY